MKKINCKKNKKAQATYGLVLLTILVVAVIGGGVWFALTSTPQSVAGTGIQSVIQETKSGDVAQIKVDVRDIASDNVNTKIAVPVYCMDSSGAFVIDATSSSTTTKISGSTVIGQVITCYAFNSTVQTFAPVVVNMDEELKQITIDAYMVSTSGTIDFYDDTFTVADNGVSNITLTSEGSDTYQKFKYTNTATDNFMPLGGFYVDTVDQTNISGIDVSGSLAVSDRANDLGSANSVLTDNLLTTRVTARKSLFDFTFEVDDPVKVEGNDGLSPILLDENDFVESGIVKVSSETSGGCVGAVDIATWYAYSKGFYREQQGTGVGYGYETDAKSSSVITADITLDTFYCAAA